MPMADIYKLPKSIINSFAIEYLCVAEKEFILACDAYNDTLKFRLENPEYNIIKFSDGRVLTITVYDPHNSLKMTTFQISDLSKFVGLCRKYKTPTEVENIIASLFKL
jgi:Xaa-Pro aminopeptidase